jgi:hypothetical protein
MKCIFEEIDQNDWIQLAKEEFKRINNEICDSSRKSKRKIIE